jgi:HD-like signal output (HDOD) protein
LIGAIVIAAGQEPFLCFDSGSNLDPQVRALRGEADLFALPQALDRMNRLLASAPVDLKGLEEAVKDDPQLVTETLKLCNSSLFRLPHPVARLEQAVIMMDAEITRALLVVCWLIKHTGRKMRSQDHQAFWGHNLLVAQMSRHLCEWANCAQPEWAFLAGLFHDIGALPFLTMLSRNGTGSPRNVLAEVGDSIESQRRRFGVDHCDFGQRMGSILGLPLWAVEIAAGHHQRGCWLSGLPLLGFVSAAELIAQSGSRQPNPLPQRQLILNALGEYLPGWSGATSSVLLETLESDLNSPSARFP